MKSTETVSGADLDALAAFAEGLEVLGRALFPPGEERDAFTAKATDVARRVAEFGAKHADDLTGEV